MKSKRGFALIVVLNIMFVLGITFSMLHKMGMQQVFTGTRIINRIKATAYAEAGIEYIYSQLLNDYTNTIYNSIYSSPNSTPFGEGSFALTLTGVDNDRYVIIKSLGHCRGQDVTCGVFVEDLNWDTSMLAFENALFGGQDGTVAGGGTVTGGAKIHMNGDVKLTGSADVTADISSGGVITGNNTITGNTVTQVYPIPVPIIEFPTSYDIVLPNKSNIKHDISGIIYIDGDVTISGKVTGTIYATGDVTIIAGGSVTSPDGSEAVISRYGNIRYSSNADSCGLFYSNMGDFTQSAGQGSITGQIIVGGSVTKTGGGDLHFMVTIKEELQPKPVIGAWQQ